MVSQAAETTAAKQARAFSAVAAIRTVLVRAADKALSCCNLDSSLRQETFQAGLRGHRPGAESSLRKEGRERSGPLSVRADHLDVTSTSRQHFVTTRHVVRSGPAPPFVGRHMCVAHNRDETQLTFR